MKEKERFSYVKVLSFRLDDELKTRLAEVQSAITKSLGGKTPVGNWYFEREALVQELKKRGRR